MNTEPVPDGFTLIQSGKDDFVIHHKRAEMGCIGIFAICWVTIWTCGCLGLNYQFLLGSKFDNGHPIPIWFVLMVWACDAFLAYLAAYLLFSTKSCHISHEMLIVETLLFGFKRRKTIPRGSIRKVFQVKDAGGDGGKISLWGLKVEGDRNATLLFRQPHESSRWLGQILAKWADVEFAELPE